MKLLSRHIKDKLLEALSDTPVVTLNGARQTGKSTLVQKLAEKDYPAQYLTLDNIGALSAAKRDPVGFLEGISGPVIIDEAQRVPELLLAIKAEVDRNRQPGRFLLTGSAHILNLPRLSDTLAGRMEILTLWPLSQGEIENRKEGFIDFLFGKETPSLKNNQINGKNDLIRRILAGGFPEVLSRPKMERRRAWFESYLSSILQRDIRDLANITGLTDLPRLLHVLASRAGGLINYADLARDSGLNQVTLKRYFTLLEGIFIARTIQPWFTNRIKRIVKSPKLYLCDSGILAHLLDLTEERLKRDPHLIGALFENFVAQELMKQRTWSRARPNIYHFRDYIGNEVDFVLEAPDRKMLVGIEVKSSATVGANDFKGLKILSETLGKNFHRGIVLYTGQEIVPFGKNLHALPISFLWNMN